MKVTYITTRFPVPSETFASSDVRILKDLGVDISVFSPRFPHKNFSAMMADRELADVPVVSAGVFENFLGMISLIVHPLLAFKVIVWLLKNDFRKPGHFLKCLLLLPASFYLLRRLKMDPPNIVHLFWGHYPSVIGYLVRHALPNIKLTMFLGAYDLRFSLGVSRSLASVVDCIFTHAKANLPQLERLGVDLERVSVVHRGMSIETLQKSISTAGYRKNKTWMAAGRLIELKCFDRVIELFAVAFKKGYADSLFIAGDGPESDRLKNIALRLGVNAVVTFNGHISQADLLKKMAESEFLFLLSSNERLPNVMKEGMLAGCICVTSRTVGIEELIEDGKTGFIIDKNDDFDFLEILSNLSLEQKELMRVAAKVHVSEYFDATISMKKYIRKWRSL